MLGLVEYPDGIHFESWNVDVSKCLLFSLHSTILNRRNLQHFSVGRLCRGRNCYIMVYLLISDIPPSRPKAREGKLTLSSRRLDVFDAIATSDGDFLYSLVVRGGLNVLCAILVIPFKTVRALRGFDNDFCIYSGRLQLLSVQGFITPLFLLRLISALSVVLLCTSSRKSWRGLHWTMGLPDIVSLSILRTRCDGLF